jgi:hypothetical protein
LSANVRERTHGAVELVAWKAKHLRHDVSANNAQHDLRRFHTLSPLHHQKASTRRIVDKRDPAFTRLGLIAIGTGKVNSNRKQRAWESDNIA